LADTLYIKIHTIKDFKFTDMYSEEMGELVCRKKRINPKISYNRKI